MPWGDGMNEIQLWNHVPWMVLSSCLLRENPWCLPLHRGSIMAQKLWSSSEGWWFSLVHLNTKHPCELERAEAVLLRLAPSRPRSSGLALTELFMGSCMCNPCNLRWAPVWQSSQFFAVQKKNSRVTTANPTGQSVKKVAFQIASGRFSNILPAGIFSHVTETQR